MRTRALILCLTLMVALGVPVLLDRFWVQPGVDVVKLGFAPGSMVQPPPDFAAVSARVTVMPAVDVPVPGAPPAVIDIYRPRAAPVRPRPIILWIHGGGFIAGSPQQVGDYATLLTGSGDIVADLGYSLAPGQHYPVPVQQGTAALDYLKANAARLGGAANDIFVGGDSAGAQIASQLAAVQTNPALAGRMDLAADVPLRGVILFCGLYDMDTVGATGFPSQRTYLWAYTGFRDWTKDPDIDQLSTTAQVTSAYPPTYLTDGDLDELAPQATELESVLRGHGIDVNTRFWTDAGLGHDYQYDLRTAPGRQVLTDVIAFVAGHAG